MSMYTAQRNWCKWRKAQSGCSSSLRESGAEPEARPASDRRRGRPLLNGRRYGETTEEAEKETSLRLEPRIRGRAGQAPIQSRGYQGSTKLASWLEEFQSDLRFFFSWCSPKS